MMMETKEPIKSQAVIYVRVASVDPGDGNGRIAMQEQRCRDYATAQGYAVARVFIDAGVSGGIAERPGLNAMLAYLETMHDRGTIVMMEDSARLARDVRVMRDLSARIRGTGARIEFCDARAVASIVLPDRILFMGARRVQI
ncbi:recombinase family protein [Stappia indica]|uniref:recombinase family protein n=1 Tax=Stappia indica TaxID=538381 RepID=UPI0008371C15|nr:recombinase family protein [Stappia indica]